MKKSKKLVLSLSISLAAFMLFVGMAGASPAVDEGVPIPEAARMNWTAVKTVAAENGIPAKNLMVMKNADATFIHSGVLLYQFKVMDKLTGEMYVVSLDQAGKQVSLDDALFADRQAYIEKYGKVSQELNLVMAEAGNSKLEVMVWLVDNNPEYIPSRPMPQGFSSEADAEQVLAENMAFGQEHNAEIVNPFMSEIAAFDAFAEADQFAPVVYAELTPAEIAEVGTWASVDMVYPVVYAEPELNVARQVVGANWMNFIGVKGTNTKLAQVEVGGRVNLANPYLTMTMNPAYICATPSFHSTGVAGIVKSTQPFTQGIASGAYYWAGGSCSGSSAELQSQTTYARIWGAQAVNLSWGQTIGTMVPGPMDRFYDGFAPNYGMTIVKSAGNNGFPYGTGNGEVTSPGMAYNVITVGNFDDNNTVGWAYDKMADSSSYVDPVSTNGDREKPEVAAPGTNIRSTLTSSPWIGDIGSGTSYAAPVVTGSAGLMMEQGWQLKFWPEGVKAILMATAAHNIEGAAALSEYDGAGGIDAKAASYVAANNPYWGKWGGMAYSCASPVQTVVNMPLTQGKLTRVAIAWDQNPAYTYYNNQPSADIDLLIQAPNGTYIAGSTSWDNTYEVVQFTPSVTGTYKILIWKSRCSLTPKFLAWAYYSR